MPETRPRSEQIRFTSSNTGEHVLDEYLEACELGGRPLYDILADIFDGDGDFSSATDFRINPSTSELEYRNSTSISWTPSGSYVFRPRGGHASGVSYLRTDVVAHGFATYICTADHTSTTAAPDLTKFQLAVSNDGSITLTFTPSGTISATTIQGAIEELDSENQAAHSLFSSAIANTVPLSTYTPADVLAKIKTVDGSGSGLDADLLAGQPASYYTDINARLGYTALDDTLYTASDVLTKIKTVDGPGSGLDADLLDGQQASYYTDIPARLGYTPLNPSAYTAADVLAKIKTVDGSSSGLDADLLDGFDSSYFTNIPARLGYTPVDSALFTATGYSLAAAANAAAVRSIAGITAVGDSVATAATSLIARINIGADGNLHKVTAHTSSGTHTFDGATNYFLVIAVGGGGAGGGAIAGSGSSGTCGAGGGAGGIVEGFYVRGSNLTITIGAGGTGVVGASGNDGGNTTVTDGTISITAGGGKGGGVSISTANIGAAAASSTRAGASGGNIRNITGSLGGHGLVIASGSFIAASGGSGADCPGFGSGGVGSLVRASSPSDVANGDAAGGYGAGGSGAACVFSTGTRTGGNGSGGCVIVYEFR